MSDAPHDREELFRLFGALGAERIAAEEHARLESLLVASAEARRLWFLHADIEHGLRRRMGAVASAKATGVKVLRPAFGARPARRWALAAAAVLVAVLAVTGGMILFKPTPASAAELVQRALAAQQGAVDRCYRVAFGRPRGAAAGGGRETLNWTRGDRFLVESRAGEGVLAWGRDEHGRVWFAPSPEAGGSFEAHEVPERLAALCELRSLQADALLHALLAHFDLRREGLAGGQAVVATLKPGQVDPRYRSARLEIDFQTNALRRVELERIAPGRPAVTVTFALVEVGLRPDASYTLAGHLRPGAPIYDGRSAPGLRGRALADFAARLRDQP